MRTPIVAGNWKMYKTLREAVNTATELAPRLAPYDNVERVICPTYIALAAVTEALADTPIKVGAQNMHWKDEGAFTSQIAPSMLKGIASYVIIGHSEVRQYLHDTDEDINKKVKAAIAHGIAPILAVGESLTQRQAGETDSHIGAQIRAGLDGIDGGDIESLVIAYEPIWAIGTGMSCDPTEAERVIGMVIRGNFTTLYGEENAGRLRIQYGGSVKPDNIAAFMAQPNIDGALVGGASLQPDDFVKLVDVASQAKKA